MHPRYINVEKIRKIFEVKEDEKMCADYCYLPGTWISVDGEQVDFYSMLKPLQVINRIGEVL